MSKTVVSSDNAPAAIGPYSPGIQTGNMVFLSGQLGIDPTTGKMPEGVEAQAKQSLANVEALLTAAGATFADSGPRLLGLGEFQLDLRPEFREDAHRRRLSPRALLQAGHAGVPGPLDLLPGHLVGHRHDSESLTPVFAL